MRTIWKYPVKSCLATIDLPDGAQIVRFDAQGFGELFIWAVVDTEAPKVPRYFQVVMTGEEIGFEYNRYIGTCFNRALVYHLFENTLP